MATVTLTFDPNEFAIGGCARCDTLLTAFKDQVIAQGVLQRDTVMLLLSVWLQDNSNRLEIFLNDGSQTIVYAEGGTGPGQQPVFNCAAFSDEVFADGFPNCSEVSRAFGVRALGLFAPEDSVLEFFCRASPSRALTGAGVSADVVSRAGARTPAEGAEDCGAKICGKAVIAFF